MTRRSMPCWFVLVTTLAWAGQARSAGFAIYEQGAAATARGGAWSAVAEGPSAIFYNPAGLGMQPGLGIEIGDTLIFPWGEHRDPESGDVTDAEASVFYPPTVYASYRLPGKVAIGFGFFVPYGLGIEWPDGWAGWEEIERIEVQNMFMNPVVAWSPVEWFSFAVGFQAVHGSVTLKKGIAFLYDRGTLAGGADAWGYGGNAGILLRFLDGRLSFGVSYRSAVKLEFIGRADFRVPVAFESTLEDQPLESRLVLPHTITVGVAGKPLEWLHLSLDVLVTTWSTFDEFGFTFPEDEDRPEDEHLSQYDPRNWKDVFSIRIGAEFLIPKVEGLALRMGFVYDRNPSPSNTMSPSLPDSDRIDVSAGLGYAFRFGLGIDVAYMYVHFFERETTGDAFPGIYRSGAHLVGLSLSYRWIPKVH